MPDKNNKSFKQFWSETITDLKNRGSSVNSADAIDKSVDAILHETIRTVTRNERTADEFRSVQNSSQEIFDIISKRHSGLIAQNSNYKRVKNEYRKLFNLYNKMLKLREQEQKAQTWDYQKTLLYRVLTTVFIATIVFFYHMAAYKMTGNSFLVNPFAVFVK